MYSNLTIAYTVVHMSVIATIKPIYTAHIAFGFMLLAVASSFEPRPVVMHCSIGLCIVESHLAYTGKAYW